MKPPRVIATDFRFFFKHYFCITYNISGIRLSLLFVILILAGLFALFEKIPLGRAVYFAFITAMTIGYGDITPHTTLGRLISVLLGYFRFTFFGIIIASATEAVRRTFQ